ncbi:hypothetical protein [Flavobacterium cerinum]|uniref:Uncharacterized protein n=1 Tax=Flavobacterium cerinum TaxID=2502784 RepID=A0A444GLP9_9FLAO|nr:hypothetical protein [Flavobacterium cerinum]RWW91857.1 hypothetical protein EPI11_17600 [Flavobacterium cerinum]
MLKITKENKQEAAKIFAANPTVQNLFVNNKSEFFTSRNLAENSVSKPKEEVTEILRSSVDTDVSEETPEEETKATVNSKPPVAKPATKKPPVAKPTTAKPPVKVSAPVKDKAEEAQEPTPVEDNAGETQEPKA